MAIIIFAGLETYKEIIKFLFGLQIFGMKLGLGNINTLLSSLDNPHLKYPTIHIAGTNGKGSTAAMIAAILTASGYKTGLYTSPHLVNFTERIRIDGKAIKEIDVVKCTKRLLLIIRKTKSTFFEATTAIAFQYFFDKKVDIAVIETGLGGRLDATNVVIPELSIITSIGFDHMEQLGNTMEDIAFEKAGIIKSKVQCLTTVENKKAMKVLRSVAVKNNSSFVDINKVCEIKKVKNNLSHQILDFKIDKFQLNNLVIEYAGGFQKMNIQLALAAVYHLMQKNYSKINRDSIRKGLNNIRKFSGLRGRFEILSNNPMIIGDVAHNLDAFQKLKRTLFDLGIFQVITVFGIMRDKDIPQILKVLKEFSKIVIACSPQVDRAISSKEIINMCHFEKIPCIDGVNPHKSVEKSISYASKNDIILICGSHYTLGDFLENINIFKN